MMRLRDFNPGAEMQPCLCHCDLHAGNIIFTELCARFVDFEYSVPYFSMFDLACFFAESTGLDADFRRYPTAMQRTEMLAIFMGDKLPN